MKQKRCWLFIEKAKSVRLHEQEKQALRSDLFLTQGAHKQAHSRQLFFQAFFVALQAHALSIVAGVLVVVLASAGGISYAAERTVPGEFLYPIKVGVNEKLVMAFAASPEKKARWSVQQTERRLVEAEKLVASRGLSLQATTQLAHAVSKHAQQAGDFAKDIEARGDVSGSVAIHSALEASLSAHSRILTAVDDAQSMQLPYVQQLIERVAGATHEASYARAKGEAELIAATPSREAALPAIVQERTGAIEAMVAEMRADEHMLFQGETAVSASAISNEIQIAEQMVQKSRVKIRENNYKQAFILLQEAERISNETSTMMSAVSKSAVVNPSAVLAAPKRNSPLIREAEEYIHAAQQAAEAPPSANAYYILYVDEPANTQDAVQSQPVMQEQK